ncbi:AbiH family protein [Kordia jejudonensis]|uniref:AbiH family protein n=1 Tax=Kordia jejudonensis TaxID=1348245 RepID=UPI0009E601CF|nr:AbiH family protein [Kordia jejudonensis]
MNKLIIAGNGFDLAHGLPTSYNHFMDAFWRDLQENQNNEIVKKVVYLNPVFQDHFKEGEIKNFKSFEANILNYLKNNLRSHEYQLETYTFSQRGRSKDYGKQVVLFKFKNEFFKRLNEVQSIANWVDVENEYYKKLKVISKLSSIAKQEKREQVLRLHKEFEQVKQLLERYLQKNIVDTYKLDPNFILNIHAEDKINKTVSYIEPEKEGSTFYIVNFNYTPTLELFYSAKSNEINYIHGKLNENIVFGFGDEMDEDYKLIEDMDDNEYLRYFKSFQYVQNSNYKDVLRYVDSEKFQVIIMGHSCGLSDRTLLNTIFEHENCRSIKVFYHQKDDGTDNYTETIQNISRHFNDKKLMRTKIVEKTLSEPMPQIQLPKKE